MVNMFDTVAVAVGSEGKTCTVHSAILGQSSKFFINTMKPEWSAARSNPSTIDLTDEDPATFEIYLDWLYFKTLPTIVDGYMDDARLNAEFCIFGKCYVLGESLMDIKFKNAMIDAFADIRAQGHKPYPGKDSITIIYEGTPENSPAMNLFIELWAENARTDWALFIDELPSAFILKLCKVLLKRKDSYRRIFDRKQFYEPEPSKPSCSEEEDLWENDPED